MIDNIERYDCHMLNVEYDRIFTFLYPLCSHSRHRFLDIFEVCYRMALRPHDRSSDNLQCSVAVLWLVRHHYPYQQWQIIIGVCNSLWPRNKKDIFCENQESAVSVHNRFVWAWTYNYSMAVRFQLSNIIHGQNFYPCLFEIAPNFKI